MTQYYLHDTVIVLSIIKSFYNSAPMSPNVGKSETVIRISRRALVVLYRPISSCSVGPGFDNIGQY